MSTEQDYLKDISEIRSMMERSSKFLSLSGWAGVLAGLYALAGAYLAVFFLSFNPDQIEYPVNAGGDKVAGLPPVIGLALFVLVLAIGSAIVLSSRKALTRGEKAWNPTARRMIESMAVPLIPGGILMIALVANGYSGLVPSLSLLFYGLALYNAGKFTFNDVKYLGFIQIGLGLAGCLLVSYGMLFWALGFGVAHIVYGLFIHLKYER